KFRAPDRRRGHQLASAKEVRKGYVGFDAQQPSGRKDVVVAALQPREVAAGALGCVEGVDQVDRPAERRSSSARSGRIPVGVPTGPSKVWSVIEAIPVITSLAFIGRLWGSLDHHRRGLLGTGTVPAADERGPGDTGYQTFVHVVAPPDNRSQNGAAQSQSQSNPVQWTEISPREGPARRRP